MSALNEEELHFLQRKKQIADELNKGNDYSPKGSLDAPILHLIELLNATDSLYTTSSCSGRTSIFQHRAGQTKGGNWLLIKHEKCDWKDFTEALQNINSVTKQKARAASKKAATASTSATSSTADDGAADRVVTDGSLAFESTGDVILRFEPFILAVECRSLLAADRILNVALACGFRESGINATQKRYMLSVRSSVRLEVPIWNAATEKMLVSDEYLQYLLDLSNTKHDKNIAKIQRFEAAVRKEYFAHLEPQLETQSKKKHYNAFEVAAANSSNSASTTTTAKSNPPSKLSPFALFNRQQRVLTMCDALEEQFKRLEENIARVKRGEPIVAPPAVIDKKKSAAVKPMVTSKPSVAASAQSTSSSSTTVLPVSFSSSPNALPLILVARAQTKEVKDALSARTWIDVTKRIIPLPQEQAQSLLPATLQNESFMRVVLEKQLCPLSKMIENIPPFSEAQNKKLVELLGLDASLNIRVYFTMAECADIASTKKQSSTSNTSNATTSSTEGLSPMAPPRVRLLHFLGPLFAAHGMDASYFEKLVPQKWEKLGDDMLIFPPGSFRSEDGWTPLLHSNPSALPALWQAVLQAWKGVQRVAIANEIAGQDVLRHSQVQLVVSGNEPFHPAFAAIQKRASDEKDGWVLHKENGVLFQFDVTRVMFSSGNGTEKARLVSLVQNENIAKGFGDKEGETIIDLYAGIGYFTMPLLVHTAVAPLVSASTSTVANKQASASASAADKPPAISPLKFLHACEWNPDSLDYLARNMKLNKISTDRFALYPGDNRRPELVELLREKADRISLGLLPSAEDTYASALKMLKNRGGVLHVHANIPSASYDAYCASLEDCFRALLTSDAELKSHSMKSKWAVKSVRLTHVKNYAPRIGHVVVEVACFPPESTWWQYWESLQKQHQQPQKFKPTPKDNKSKIYKESSDDEKKSTSEQTDSVSSSSIAPLSLNASSDPSQWFAYPHSLPIVTSPSMEQFREIVAGQTPVLLRGLQVGEEGWAKKFTPQSLLALSSRSPNSSACNPTVSVHVSPQSTRMDFLQRNYLFKTMKLKEMLERMLRIGANADPASTSASSSSSSAASAPRSAETAKPASSPSAPITRDSYFVSPNELYYLRSLGANPKTEVAQFQQSFPELAKLLRIPPRETASGAPYIEPERIFSSIFRISSAGLQLWTHYDITDNLLIHLHGLKRVVLFPPSAAVGLGLKPEADSSSSPILDVDSSSAPTGQEWSKAQAQGVQVLLMPGDVLYIPALWFHNVTSLCPKQFADAYHKVMQNSCNQLDLVPSVEQLQSLGNICVSLNLFWRELSDDYYQAKDLYGNKDLLRGVNVLGRAAEIAQDLQALPPQYSEFYGKRALDILQKQTQDVTTQFDAKTAKNQPAAK